MRITLILSAALALLLFGILAVFAPRNTITVVSEGLSGVTDPAIVDVLSSGASRNAPRARAEPQENEDIPKQVPLPNPPEIVKGIYLTSWSAGAPLTMKRVTDLLEGTELNGVVIDIKDFSGSVAYRTGLAQVLAAGAEDDIRIRYPHRLIKDLHDRGVYVIGRVSVFQDSVLAKARPELALRDTSTGEAWTDRKGLAWMDSASREVWEYNAAIAEDALSRGFDEINFDYVRFASDGDLERIAHPVWDERTPKADVMRDFFSFLRSRLPGAKISADLFGLTTVNKGDLGIGQVIESAYEYFDFVSPMVYPSHYAPGFLGYKNPAAYPYEVVKYSMDNALSKIGRLTNILNASSTASSTPFAIRSLRAKLRPWLQDFDLGAMYDETMVRAEIRATEDALVRGSSTDRYAGWLLWDPANKYTEGALESAGDE